MAFVEANITIFFYGESQTLKNSIDFEFLWF